MKNVEISRQKAIAILKRDIITDGRLGPIDKAMFGAIQPHEMLKRGEEILLKKGSKLKLTENKYYICGYAQDGGDVDYYFKRKQ